PRAQSPAVESAVVLRSYWENPYPDMEFPSAEYRLLALFRWWNVVEYFYPYKYLMDRNWRAALTEFIPRMESSRDAADYQIAVIEVAARLPDAHILVQNANAARRRLGEFAPPLTVESVQGRTVVVALRDPDAVADKVKVGDVVLALDGEDIDRVRGRLERLAG